MASSSLNNKSMEKTAHQPLQCPRCSSCNTKFCYYNNYSLSQPRHFCKACKRYWTRGGALRNVPVGGGCRKNKRAKVKRRQTTSFNHGISYSVPVATTIKAAGGVARSSGLEANRCNNMPSFYSNPREIKFPFPMFGEIRVSSNSTELGFLSEFGGNDQIRNISVSTSNSSIQSSAGNIINPFLLRSSGFPSTSTSTMASLLASTFHQEKFQEIRTLDEDVRMQAAGNQMNCCNSSSPVLLNRDSNDGEWFDYPSDLGCSSLPSLI